jgi:hypothetical protein
MKTAYEEIEMMVEREFGRTLGRETPEQSWREDVTARLARIERMLRELLDKEAEP